MDATVGDREMDEIGFTVPLLQAVDSSLEVLRPSSAAASAGPPMSFERKTTKYWVRLRDVELAKRLVSAELPFAPAWGDNVAGDAQLANSVYLDNAEKELYRGRLNKDPQAVAIRLRWYGTGEPRTVFVERKTHKDDWAGERSLKERFALRADNVHAFLCGEYTVQDAEAAMREQGKSSAEITTMATLFGEIYSAIRTRNLEPAVRSQYMRVAWQSDENARVRISLDTQLSMMLENPSVGASTLESGRWFRDPLLPMLPGEVTWFPHAVLELKLGQADTDGDHEVPEWVEELLQSSCHEVYKFSKFVHGTATLQSELVAQVPYWMDDASIISSVTASTAAEHPARPGQGDGPTLMDRVDTAPLLGHSRRQGVCGKECCNGLTEMRFCCWAGHSADTMQRARPIRIEPKTFFANERTFLSWVHMAVIMGSIGGALLGMAHKGGDSEAPTTITRTTNGHTTVTVVTKVQHVGETGETIGMVMITTAICFVVYAVLTYYWRARKIRMRLDGPYDDRIGPGLLGAALLAGFVVSLYMRLAEASGGVDPDLAE